MRKKHKHTATYKDESRYFYAACSLFVACACVYMYFVSMSVMNVVMRKEIDTKIAEAATRISELEAAYIEVQHSVSSDIASHKGFAIADTKVFIDKSDATLVLSRN